MSTSVYVFDASVGVKWFKPEDSSDVARGLLKQLLLEADALVAPTHFFHEVLSVVRRHYTPDDVVSAWRIMRQAGIQDMPLTDEVVAEAAAQCTVLGCSFYDALAPACASLLGATLVSADARAHGVFPGALII